MKNSKPFKKILIVLGVFAVAFLVAYYFIYQDIKYRNEHIASLVQELNFQSSRQEYLISTQRMIQSINSDIDKISNSIVATDGDVAFIEGLESLAKNNNLTIKIDSLVIEENANLSQGGIVTLKIDAKTKGSWVGTYTFISQLESLPFKIKVDKFAMSGSPDESGTTPAKSMGSSWQSSFEIHVLKYK